MREERKVVTVLSADLVNSTPLGEAMDPEEVRLIIGEAVGRMVHAVEAFGGTVKDLAGDGILALFGAPQTHEDDPERAILAGLRLLGDIHAYGAEVARAWGVGEFSVRVGVATGSVVVGPVGGGSRIEYGATGDTVNTAARLQAAARPGRLLALAATRAATEQLFRWGESQQLSLKGKAESVPASEVLGEAEAGRALPPERARFIGRDRELATAWEAVESVLAGAGQILFVSGDAGIGKSRLLAELRRRLQDRPTGQRAPLWLEGRSVSYAESIPYSPFRELLRDWLGVAGQADLRTQMTLRRRVESLFGEDATQITPYLASVLGLAAQHEPPSDQQAPSPEEVLQRTFAAIAALLERLAQDAPLVLALEDLHWSDATSIQLAGTLLPLTEQAALLLVLTGRPERDRPFWELKERAARELPHRTDDVTLRALPRDSDRELLYALVGEGTLPGASEREILQVSDGNPFYLEELVQSLIDQGSLVREGDGWRFDHDVSREIPATVEKVILSRIDRLSPPAHRVLVTASVLGKDFGLPLLEGLLGDAGVVADALSELQRLDLLREAGRWPQPEYRFKHALTQDVVYATLLREQREELHRKAAGWLESVSTDREQMLGLLAHHWRAAGDRKRAVEYLLAAAEQAGRGWAKQEALNLYDQAFELTPEETPQRRSIAMKRAVALMTFTHSVKDIERDDRADEE